MTGAIEYRYYGRDFTEDEITLLRALIATDPQPTRASLSREFCQRIGWLKPDRGPKDMMARVTILAMHRDGVITLPPPKGRRNPPRPIVFGPDTEPPLFPAPARGSVPRKMNGQPAMTPSPHRIGMSSNIQRLATSHLGRRQGRDAEAY